TWHLHVSGLRFRYTNLFQSGDRYILESGRKVRLVRRSLDGGGEALPLSHLLDTGGKYDLSTDTWAETSTTNAPSTQVAHTAVWTGSEMIVWGGDSSGGAANNGGRYSAHTVRREGDSDTAAAPDSTPAVIVRPVIFKPRTSRGDPEFVTSSQPRTLPYKDLVTGASSFIHHSTFGRRHSFCDLASSGPSVQSFGQTKFQKNC